MASAYRADQFAKASQGADPCRFGRRGRMALQLVIYEDVGHGGIFQHHTDFVLKALSFLAPDAAAYLRLEKVHEGVRR
jgi:hypothetical protein